MEWTPGERRKRGRPKKYVDGRRTSSHGNKTSRSRSVVKQKGMGFGFRKTATAVVGPEIDRYQYTNSHLDVLISIHFIGHGSIHIMSVTRISNEPLQTSPYFYAMFTDQF
jgi:hypothetical protein